MGYKVMKHPVYFIFYFHLMEKYISLIEVNIIININIINII